MLAKARHIIVEVIDFFHQPFVKIIPTQTFRYLACGGSNTVLGIAINHIAFTYILHKRSIPLYNNLPPITPEVGAWIIAFCISFPAGFILSRHVVFPESNLHGKIQLFRYLLTTVVFNILNYILIKALALWLPGVHQTVRFSFICVFLSILSYILQRTFTFKSAAVPAVAE